jgi:CRP-like cAMP-binding protein
MLLGRSHPVVQRFGEHPLLRHFPSDELAAFLRASKQRTYREGEFVFVKGDPGETCFLVLSGRIRICSFSPEGRISVLDIVAAGEIFGEMALLDEGQRSTDADALEDSELLIMRRRDILPLLSRYPPASMALLRLLSSRLRRTTDQLEDFAWLSLAARLAKRLLALSAAGGSSSGELAVVSLPQGALAGMVGASRQAVNKQLRCWEEGGLICLKRGAIVVVDRARLAQVVALNLP